MRGIRIDSREQLLPTQAREAVVHEITHDAQALRAVADARRRVVADCLTPCFSKKRSNLRRMLPTQPCSPPAFALTPCSTACWRVAAITARSSSAVDCSERSSCSSSASRAAKSAAADELASTMAFRPPASSAPAARGQPPLSEQQTFRWHSEGSTNQSETRTVQQARCGAAIVRVPATQPRPALPSPRPCQSKSAVGPTIRIRRARSLACLALARRDPFSAARASSRTFHPVRPP